MPPQHNDWSFRSRAPYHKAHFATLNKQLGAFTANDTTLFIIGAHPHRCVFDEARIVCQVKPADADGTLLLRLRKYRAVQNDFVTLTPDFDLEGAGFIVNEASLIVASTGLAAATRILLPGDVLFAEVTNNSAAIDTQATDLVVTATLCILSPR